MAAPLTRVRVKSEPINAGLITDANGESPPLLFAGRPRRSLTATRQS